MSLLQHKKQIFYLKTLFIRLHNVKIITFLNFAGLHKKIIVFFLSVFELIIPKFFY